MHEDRETEKGTPFPGTGKRVAQVPKLQDGH